MQEDTTEAEVQVVAVKRRRRRPAGGGPTSAIREQVIDIDQAMKELAIVKDEIAALPDDIERWRRRQVLMEPMSRLDMVMRFLENVMRKNGWERGVEGR